MIICLVLTTLYLNKGVRFWKATITNTTQNNSSCKVKESQALIQVTIVSVILVVTYNYAGHCVWSSTAYCSRIQSLLQTSLPFLRFCSDQYLWTLSTRLLIFLFIKNSIQSSQSFVFNRKKDNTWSS